MPRPTPKMRLFVYGSLMRGRQAHEMISSIAGARRTGTASVSGKLVDLGDYPGAVLDAHASTEVRGELWEMPYRSATLRSLDEYEEFDPRRPERSLFVRRRVRVRLGTVHTSAWIYVVRAPRRSAPVIASGAWAG